MLDVVEIKPDNPNACVIWLHGLGADGHDFVDIIPALQLPDSLRIHFIFPHAPMRPITVNAGMTMRGWYDIREMSSLQREEDADGIETSANQIQSLIEHAKTQGFTADQILLAGFSQGGAMALHVGLRYPESLAGILALSTYLVLPKQLAHDRNPANNKIPVLQVHGSEDAIVPLSVATHCYQTLKKLQYPIDLKTYPMEHQLCAPEIQDIRAFFLATLYP